MTYKIFKIISLVFVLFMLGQVIADFYFRDVQPTDFQVLIILLLSLDSSLEGKE